MPFSAAHATNRRTMSARDGPRADEEPAAERDAERRRRARVERADPLPRALDAAPDGRVEDAAARDLEAREAGAVEDLGDAEHLAGRDRPASGSCESSRIVVSTSCGTGCSTLAWRLVIRPLGALDGCAARAIRRAVRGGCTPPRRSRSADRAPPGGSHPRVDGVRCASGPGDVARLARIDLDPLADVDEQRHLDDGARLERRGLRHVRDGVALDAGLGLGDRELDRRRAAGSRTACRSRASICTVLDGSM